MPVVYLGVLSGDRIEWQGRSRPPDGPVRVTVVVPDPPVPGDEERRRVLREAFEALAAGGRINAAEWQRQRDEIESYDPRERPGDDAR